jgi:hypothetical protein
MDLEVRILNELWAHFLEVRILNGLRDFVEERRNGEDLWRVSRPMIPAIGVTVKRIVTGRLFERRPKLREWRIATGVP